MRKWFYLLIVVLTPISVWAQSIPNTSNILRLCKNGECGFKELIGLVNELLKWAMLGTTTFATIMFVYAGFLYISAQGDPNQIKKAHNIFRVVIIGFVIIFSSFLLIKEILQFLGVVPGPQQLLGK